MIPTLHTERLILRPPELADFEPYAEIMGSKRADQMGGPYDREAAWADFCDGIACWHLRGYGAWSITKSADGSYMGLVYLYLEEGSPEQEMGWILTAEAEGHGYATEAALSARIYAYKTLNWPTVVSYIEAENTGSLNVAERMGAVIDTAAAQPVGKKPCLVYRHPAPEALQ